MKEQDIVKAILDYLNWQGYYVMRINAGMMFTNGRAFRGAPAGVSDIIGITPDGKFLAIEVKVPTRKNKMTKLQEQFLREVNGRRGIAFIATSIDDVKKYL